MQAKAHALHEAAHAVARCILSGGIEYAQVGENPHTRPLRSAMAHTEQVCILAGLVSEWTFSPSTFAVGHYGGEDLERFKHEFGDGALRSAMENTKRFVSAHSKQIQAVAAMLQQNGRVSGEEVRSLL